MNENEFLRKLEQVPERRKYPIDFYHYVKKKEIIQVENLTICVLHLWNGFKVQGQAACLVESECDYDTASRLAYESAVSKMWEYWAFFMAEWRYIQHRANTRAKKLQEGKQLLSERNQDAEA